MKIKVTLITILLFNFFNLSAQNYTLEVSTEDYISPEEFTSLCEAGEIIEGITLDFGFEFPYFGKKYTNIEAIKSSDYFIDTSPENSTEGFFDVSLNSEAWAELGWFMGECISDWRYFHTEKEEGTKCLNFEWYEFGYFPELSLSPFTPNHSFNFQTRFCEDGEISVLFGEADYEMMSKFKQGQGFEVFPGEWQGSITELLMPFDEDVYFGIAGTPDSIFLYDNTSEEFYDMPYWPHPGTRVSFFPNVDTRLDNKKPNVAELKIFPNPVTDRFFIEIPEDSDFANTKMNFKLVAADGRVFRDGVVNGNSKSEVSAQNLPSGFYSVLLSSEDNTILYTGKFIKL